MDEFPLKMFSRDSASNNGCFDCNICLDFAVDPVVTLCGHLYCWPCIYKWLHMEGRISTQSCPVCKAALSERSLVPLYGRGAPAKRHRRRRAPIHQHHHHLHPHHSHGDELLASSLPPRMMSSATVGMLGEMAVAVLPWVFRNHQVGAAMAGGLYYSSPYQQAVGGGLRLRRLGDAGGEMAESGMDVSLLLCHPLLSVVLIWEKNKEGRKLFKSWKED